MYCNAQMSVAHIQKYCVLDEECTGILKEQCEKYVYSARVIHKLLRMARTAADVRGSSRIGREDIIKVLSCREEYAYNRHQKIKTRGKIYGT